MRRCSHADCSWQAIAPSREVALSQYADHLVTEHATAVDAQIPDGMVQIKLDEGDEWITTTLEDARKLHETVHDD